MKIELAQHDRMTESGSSLLRLIQNQNIPILDLLVREAFQNSLDAGDPNQGRKDVLIGVACKQFVSTELNKHFEGISQKLDAAYPPVKRYKSLVVADQGTTGLTGPVTYEEVKNNDFGNCLKLIYEISKPQTKEGSGGSWGLGKTIYYRVGMGLVIYYSRIKLKSGRYESRLAACLVEDEKKSNTLLPSEGGVKRGIAWWGEERPGKRYTVPVTDESEIRKILNIFRIRLFTGSETGTVFIIPYINDEALLKETYEGESIRPPWTYNIEEYLRVAAQRWYAPRINNPAYKGLSLTVWIGDSMVKPTEMLPLFRIVREMYIYQARGSLPPDSYLGSVDAEMHKEDIQVRGVLNASSSGSVVFTKLSRDQLKMTPPENNMSPYMQISNDVVSMEQGNTPVVMFTRKPGMIVGYDYSGPWTSRIPRTDENEYIIGLFVANSGNTFKDLKDSETGKSITVEEYLRQCEKADHAVWADKSIDGNNTKLVLRMQNGVNNKIAAVYGKQDVVAKPKKIPGLGQALARFLLPSKGFGNESTDPTPPHRVGQSKGNKRKALLSLEGDPVYNADTFTTKFMLTLYIPCCNVNLQVMTDYSRISAEAWEEETGKAFPFSLEEIIITEIKPERKGTHWQQRQIPVNMRHDVFDNDDLAVSLCRSERTGKATGFNIRRKDLIGIKGIMVFRTTDRSLNMSFETREVKE